jgi:hypothetical protein
LTLNYTHTHTHRFDKPVLFERHAVGGEYQAGYTTVGAGTLETVFTGIHCFVLF